MKSMIFCKNCLLPETYDTIKIYSDGDFCNICADDVKNVGQIDWTKKKKILDTIIEKYRNKYEYDCIIPFSGGKDSTFALYYLVTQYNLKPLVVRFDAGFMRPIQAENIRRTLKALDVDYISFTPNWRVVKLLMREAFDSKTDFCWHCHTGVYSYPLRIAVKYNTPLVFWGESLSKMLGNYSLDDDAIEFEDAERFDAIRTLGIDANAMHARLLAKGLVVDPRDLTPYTYPTPEELERLQYYSICLGSFIPWDYRANTSIIQKELGWQIDTMEGVPLELNREGAKIECWLQAARDYIKFLKRGYGRVTQCVNFEIREGRMSTQEGRSLIAAHEGKKPFTLPILLEYLDMTEDEFNTRVGLDAVSPQVPDFNLPQCDKPHDYDAYYQENSQK